MTGQVVDPVLPTEVGSVILDVRVTGSEASAYPLGVLIDSDVIPWRLISADEDDYGRWVSPAEIVSWTPAKVVPA